MSISNVIEFRTPSYVLSEMSTVDASLKSLLEDVNESTAPNAFRRGLAEFALEWVKFYNEHSKGVGAWWARATIPVYNKVVDFQARVREWQTKFQAIGGKLSQPAIKTPEAREKAPYPRWLIIGGLLAIGAGTYWVVKQRRESQPPWLRGRVRA